MKNVKLSLFAIIALGTLLNAGGDIAVVTPYEVEDEQYAAETYVEPVQEYVEPVDEYVEPEYVEPVAEAYIEPTSTPVAAPVAAVAPVAAKTINPSGFYAGLGIAAAQYDPNCNCSVKDNKKRSVGAVARVGYDFNKYVGIEARGIRTSGSKVQHAGLFVKPMIPVGDATNVYGLAGFAKTTTKGSAPKTNAKGLALGLGVEVDLSKDTPKEGRYGRPFDGKGNQEKGVGVFLDYERMLVKSGAPKLDAVSTGVTYDF